MKLFSQDTHLKIVERCSDKVICLFVESYARISAIQIFAKFITMINIFGFKTASSEP